jgi:hypothetical protein
MPNTLACSLRRRAFGTVALSLCLFAGTAAQAQEFRTITGEFNNPTNPLWGSAGTILERCPAGAFYGGVDQTWEMGGENRVSARMVSNFVFAQSELIFDDRALTNGASSSTTISTCLPEAPTRSRTSRSPWAIPGSIRTTPGPR